MRNSNISWVYMHVQILGKPLSPVDLICHACNDLLNVHHCFQKLGGLNLVPMKPSEEQRLEG